ncbi:MAG: 50S ribosomal protein L35ae [Candidatus Nanoarchaeia archaeon]
MKGVVVNYRGSYKEQNPKHMIVRVEGVEKRADTKKILGKKVTWTSPAGKKISGVISAPHGSKGQVRVIFAEKGLPGQALGSKVDVE